MFMECLRMCLDFFWKLGQMVDILRDMICLSNFHGMKQIEGYIPQF